MKTLGRVVAVGVVGVWAGLCGVVAAGQGSAGANPTRDVKTVTNGAPKRAMTFADMMAMKRVSDPQISPSGKWVMFSVTDVSLEKNTKVNHLWVVPLGGGGTKATTEILTEGQNDASGKGSGGTNYGDSSATPQNDSSKSMGGGGAIPPRRSLDGAPGSVAERQVTFGDGESFGRFSPDGKWVSYSAKDQIYVAAWDEAAGKVGEARQLTRVTGGADGAVWSPDSKRLMFVADVWPECSVKGGTDPTHDGEAVMNGAPTYVIGGTRDVSAWKEAEPAGWVEEEACDKAKGQAADATQVKGQEWDGLLYRHWDHWTGQTRSHVLVVSADGSGVRDLTPASAVGDVEVPTYFVGGAQDYAWAPDSKEIAYVTNLDKVPAASTNNDVFTLRLDEAGAKAVKVSTSPGSDDGPAYSPDGKWLAFRSQARNGFESDKFRLMVVDRGTKAIRELMPQFEGWVDEFVWAPDSKAVYFASGMSGAANIFRYSFVDKTLTLQTRGVRGFEISNDVSIFHSENDLGEYSDIHISSDGNFLVAGMVTMRAPTEIVSLRVEDREEADDTLQRIPRHASDGSVSTIRNVLLRESRITHFNDRALTALDVPKMESFWFTGAEGTKVEGFILRPPNFDPAKKYPVKFLMHGGPQTAWGDGWSYRWNWELMAADGYVVVGINRRGSTGYGQKFVDEVSGDWGGRAYVDLMKGLDYAETKYPFMDKARECALGASYGGFMADWVLTHTNRFKCIVTHDGMYDPVSAWGDTEEMWFNEWEFRRPEDFPKGWDGFSGSGGTKANTGVLRSVQDDGGLVGGHAAEPWRYQNLPADQDPFRKWSPMRFIENAKTPTLVIHSQKDYRLDVSQGMEMFTALQRLGVPSKMLYFPDEGHWVLKPQNAELWNAEVGDWCDRWTKSGKYAVGQ